MEPFCQLLVHCGVYPFHFQDSVHQQAAFSAIPVRHIHHGGIEEFTNGIEPLSSDVNPAPLRRRPGDGSALALVRAHIPLSPLPFALYANQNYCHATVFCYAPSMASTVLDEDIASGQFLLSAIIKFENNLS